MADDTSSTGNKDDDDDDDDDDGADDKFDNVGDPERLKAFNVSLYQDRETKKMFLSFLVLFYHVFSFFVWSCLVFSLLSCPSQTFILVLSCLLEQYCIIGW